MASLINQQITLDLIPGPVVKTVSVSQYDTGTRTLQFKIQNDGVDFTIPSGITASIEATKKDLTGFSYPCTISGNTVSVVVQPQMTVFPGKTMCEIVFKQGNDRIGTANFWLKVEDAALNDSTIISETDIPGIANLSEAMRTAVESAESAEQDALDAEAWAVGTRDGVAVEETDPAYHNNSKYYSETFEGDVDRIEALVAQAEALAESIYSIGIVEEASGDPASFADGASNVPMKSVSVGIEPVQSGSGDPSPDNVRPISGWDEVKVTRTGKNLTSFESGAIETNGTHTANTARVRTPEYIPVVEGQTYTFNAKADTTDMQGLVYLYADDNNSEKINTASWENLPYTFTVPTGARYVTFVGRRTNNATLPVSSVILFQLEKGTTSTDYEAYNGQTFPISLTSAGTVYGGTLDAVSGKLVVDRASVDLGSLSWSLGSTGYFNGYLASVANTIVRPLDYSSLCDGAITTAYSQVSSNAVYNNTTDGVFAIRSANGNVWVRDNRYSDATSFKTAVTGVLLVYPIITPVEYQLTPSQITSLLGVNHIWADCGEVAVEYVADTKMYIQNLLASQG